MTNYASPILMTVSSMVSMIASQTSEKMEDAMDILTVYRAETVL